MYKKYSRFCQSGVIVNILLHNVEAGGLSFEADKILSKKSILLMSDALNCSKFSTHKLINIL